MIGNNTGQRRFAQPILSKAEALNITEPMKAEPQVAQCASRTGELDS